MTDKIAKFYIPHVDLYHNFTLLVGTTSYDNRLRCPITGGHWQTSGQIAQRLNYTVLICDVTRCMWIEGWERNGELIECHVTSRGASVQWHLAEVSDNPPHWISSSVYIMIWSKWMNRSELYYFITLNTYTVDGWPSDNIYLRDIFVHFFQWYSSK